MIRFTPIRDAGAAGSYYGKTDGGYYLDGAELHREVGGKGAAMLGLLDKPDLEQFTRLLNGLHPLTGQRLTQRLDKDRIAGWDMTASVPKGVTEAIEGGDSRVQAALWEAVREAAADVEQKITTRVRKGGRQEDRITGNGIFYFYEHPETRPLDDGSNMPDPDRHIHVVMPSVTVDPVEQEWKAIKWRPIIDLRRWFSARFDLRLSNKLAELGYAIKTEYRADPKGGQKYYSWDIDGIPASMIAKDSRRHQEIEKLAEEKGLTSPLAKAKLGATSRKKKRDDLTLEDCREYWDSKRTPEEKGALEETIRQAKLGVNPRPEAVTTEAAAFAIEHHYERNSVVRTTALEVTAMERMMGRGRPEDVLPELKRQGVLIKDGQATTEKVWAQERHITGFARETRGSMAPLGVGGEQPDLAGMTRDQKNATRHIWSSPDQVLLIRGGAGTGKTTAMRTAIAGTGTPVEVVAPSADASRSELREQGFKDAETVAAFLASKERQEQVRGGVIWCDEAGMLAIDDLEALCTVCKDMGAKLVLQGDPLQHKSVARHGNMLNVLHDFAGLPVAELKEIKRQEGDYAVAVAAIRDGAWEKADKILRRLGWVVEGEGHQALVEEYARAIKETKAVKVDGKVQMVPKSVIVVDPTHKDGDALSQQLRALRRTEGLIEGEEKPFQKLVPLSWTNAEKLDANRYSGEETVRFFRNTGPFKAGQRVKATELLPALSKVNAKHFQVYGEQSIHLAKGDVIRLTAGGKTKDGHRVDNGRIDRVAAINEAGDVVLSNGWVLDKRFGHWKHGLVSTSHAAQSKTQDIVLAAMNKASLGAIGAEQAYVTISRGRERGIVFTDLPRQELLDAMRRSDLRRSATELMATPAPRKKYHEKTRTFAQRMRKAYRRLRERPEDTVKTITRNREAQHVAFTRRSL